ncbi:MAG TPA: hypothetical protein VHM70_18215 [Polyangiaceae bacterium]|nr:hypothetical protein [Polyangiaceae bacterium]
MSTTAFARHVFQTYRHLRVAMTVACGLLAVGLVVAGGFLNLPIQPTLSNYYYAELPPAYLRTGFVALLVSLGVMLLAYRGYTKIDNDIHNVAGAFSIGIAIFPMQCPFTDKTQHFDLCVTTPWDGLHYSCAVLAFGAALVSIAYGGGKHFRRILTADVLRALDRWRWGCMVVIGLGVLFPAYALAFGKTHSMHPFVIVAESGAFLGFGAYWWALTWCVSKVNEQRRQQRKKPEVGVKESVAVDTAKAPEDFELEPLAEIP